MALDYNKINLKVAESRKKGVREDIIQTRISEIESGFDADEYQIPDAPAGSFAPPPVKPDVDYAALRTSQAKDINFDLSQGGKNVDKIKSYYSSFQPSDLELEANKKTTEQTTAARELKILSEDILQAEKERAAIDSKFKGRARLPFSVNTDESGAITGGFGKLIDGGISPYEATRNRVGFSTASGITGQSGRGLSDKDLKAVLPSVPTIKDSPDEVKNKLNSLKNNIKTRLKESAGYSDEQANAYAVDFASKLAAAQVGKPKEKMTSEGLVKNAVNDAKQIGESVWGVAQELGSGKPKEQIMVETALRMPGALIEEGKQIVKDPVKYAYDNPLDTALTVLPSAKALKGLKGARAVEAGEVVVEGGRFPGFGKKAQAAANTVSEGVTGGGTKELISKSNRLDEVEPLAVVRNRYGTNGKVTATGKLKATDSALQDIGAKTDKILEKSPVRYDGSKLAAEMNEDLVSKWGASNQGLIDDVTNQLGQQGDFDITSGTNIVTPVQLNKAKQGLRKHGIKFFKADQANGSMVKAIADDAASFLMKRLDTDVKEVTPLNRDYMVLKTDYDDVLGNPRGLNLSSIPGFVAGGVQTGVNFGAQKLYNMGRETPAVMPPSPSSGVSAQLSQPVMNTVPFKTNPRPLMPESPQNKEFGSYKRDKRATKKAKFNKKK